MPKNVPIRKPVTHILTINNCQTNSSNYLSEYCAAAFITRSLLRQTNSQKKHSTLKQQVNKPPPQKKYVLNKQSLVTTQTTGTKNAL